MGLCSAFVCAGPASAEQPASAQQKVLLLLDPTAVRPGLLAALRIQLSGVAEVEPLTMERGGSVPARIALATELSLREHALLAVWTVGPALDEDASDVVLYLVGQRERRALVEVVRVPGGEGPDLDRTLALKVRVALDELERSGAASPGGVMLAPPSPEGPKSWGALFGAGAIVGPQTGAAVGQWGAHLRAGPSLLVTPFRLSLELALAWFPALRIESAGDSVRVSELAPGLALHAQVRQAALWLGLRSGVALVWVQASGRSRSGTQGQGSEQLAVLENGVDVELPIARGLGVELELLAQTWLDRQRFAVNGREIADLGRLRPLARLTLTWAVPAMQ
ncbi:MAG: hypothetical protein ACHQ53_13440 [Polyangiales bacterium]